MSEEDYLYHVTYFKNLDGIAEEGLLTDQSPAIGGSPYKVHREGCIFLTEYSGVPFWMERSETWAYDSSDDVGEEGFIPVTLRVPLTDDLDEALEEDEFGSTDSKHDAWKLEGELLPEALEVFFDGEWLPIEEWDEIDISDALDSEGYIEDAKLLPQEHD